jgi:hypothetical protein
VVDKLRTLRGPGESYSDVILRLRAKEASGTIGLQRGFDANPDR